MLIGTLDNVLDNKVSASYIDNIFVAFNITKRWLSSFFRVFHFNSDNDAFTYVFRISSLNIGGNLIKLSLFVQTTS